MGKEIKINEVCNFKEITNLVGNKKINAITSCFFIMDTSSRYKNLYKYLNGINEVVEYIVKDKFFKDFYYILFIDNSVTSNKKIYDYIKKIFSKIPNKGILFHYDCPNFKDINTGLHYGLFGTLIRFLPFLDFPENPVNLALCIDIDNMKHRLDRLIILTQIIIDNKADLCYKSYDSELVINRKTTNKRHNHIINHPIPYFITAGQFGGYGKIPLKIFTDFIIEARDNPEKYKDHVEKNKSNITKFLYGIDEYFLNEIVLKYFIDNDKIITPYIPYNFFTSVGITDKNSNLKKILNYLNIEMKDYDKYNLMNELINSKNYDLYINKYNKIYNDYKNKDFTYLDKEDLLNMKPYLNYIIKRYYKVYKGKKFIKDVNIISLKIKNNKIIKYDNTKHYGIDYFND